MPDPSDRRPAAPGVDCCGPQLPAYECAMLLIVGTIRLPPANLANSRPFMEAMVTASRAEEGCIEYSYAEDVLEPGLIHVKEMWRDQVALDAHFASSHIARWRASWRALGITDRQLRAYEVGSSRWI